MKYKLHFFLFSFLSFPCTLLTSQIPAGYWQQRVEYQLDVRLDDQTHAVQGRLKLKYFNNSPDTLRRVFFHLYWNAFQPNSSYAKWAKQTNDNTVSPKLFDLKPDEIGKQEVFSVQQNGGATSFKVNETIMEVELNRPLKPGDYDVFDIAWQGQVPVTIKRCGRDNSAGVAYTFTQWYPKICAYDRDGWHADPYIGREFYGEFGTFKADITLPKKYVVAATGVLQNASTIGYGYENEGVVVKPNYGLVNIWKFTADNVHDFAWAADPEYTHEKIKVRDNLTLHFFYQPNEEATPIFQDLKKFAVQILPHMESNYGRYLYPQFSFVQGGEWAMEYPMLTLMEKTGPKDQVPETAAHEWMHNWYYGMIGNNENDEHWLDEGFASYAASDILSHVRPDSTAQYRRAALDIVAQVASQIPEPIGTPANLYQNSNSYLFNAYPKAESFLWQLRYIIGDEAFKRGMLRYHADWQFKHPQGADFVRVMERASGMELDWYYAGWIKTLKTIDYAVESVIPDGSSATKITLKRHGAMPMPAEILIAYKNGDSERRYIPLDVQYGTKVFPAGTATVEQTPWSFAVDTYEIRVDKPVSDVKSVTIDPDAWTADVKRENNRKVF